MNEVREGETECGCTEYGDVNNTSVLTEDTIRDYLPRACHGYQDQKAALD